LLAVSGLLSCYRPDAEIGAPCSPLGDCPDGQTCNANASPPTCVTSLPPPIDASTDAPPIDGSGSGSGSGSGVGSGVAGVLQVGDLLLGSGDVDLTSEGTTDWVHWGLGSADSIDRKLTGSGIGDLTPAPEFGGSGIGISFTASWSDGAPDPIVSMTDSAVAIIGPGAAMQVTALADTTTRTLRLYALVDLTSAELDVALSDASATASPITESTSGAGVVAFEFTIRYRAASAGQTLTVTWKSNATAEETAIGVMSATLQ